VLEENLNLVRKVVWSFVKVHPGLEFDDLFSEACIACLEAQNVYKPERGKKSTFIWHVVSNHLRTILYKEAGKNTAEEPKENLEGYMDSVNNYPGPEEFIIAKENWEEIMSSLSPEGQTICEILLHSENLPINKPKKCRGEIIKVLRSQGWGWNKIWKSFNEVKQAL